MFYNLIIKSFPWAPAPGMCPSEELLSLFSLPSKIRWKARESTAVRLPCLRSNEVLVRYSPLSAGLY